MTNNQVNNNIVMKMFSVIFVTFAFAFFCVITTLMKIFRWIGHIDAFKSFHYQLLNKEYLIAVFKNLPIFVTS